MDEGVVGEGWNLGNRWSRSILHRIMYWNECVPVHTLYRYPVVDKSSKKASMIWLYFWVFFFLVPLCSLKLKRTLC